MKCRLVYSVHGYLRKRAIGQSEDREEGNNARNQEIGKEVGECFSLAESANILHL